MSKCFSLAVPLALALAAAPPASPQEVLKPKDQQKIGRRIADYLEAFDKEKGITEAQEGLQKELEKIGKKHGDDPLQAALALSADLGKALYYSTDYNASARKVKGGSVETYEAEFNGAEISYSVWAPKKYKPKDGPYPLILAIPGVDSGGKNQRSQDHLIEDWKDADLRAGAVIVAFDMPEDREAWAAMSSAEGQPGGVPTVMVPFGRVRTTYAIDFDRVFLAGRGPGVAAAVNLAAMYPHLFAGVIGRAGDVGDTDPTNFRNLPTFFAGAGAGATAFSEKLAALGVENCTIVPDATEADVWAWMQDHPRQGNPLHVTLRPGSPIPNKAYWVQVPPVQGGEDTLVDVVVDRESNTVTVTGKGVESVTLYFNDQIVDLSKPVHVVCNGQASEHKIVRNLTVALDLITRGHNDPGRFYVAQKRFDLPQ